MATNIFVTNFGNDTVGEYTTSGATVNASLISGLSEPTGIAVSGSNLFIASHGTDTFGEYTTSGATVSASLVPGLGGASGVAVSGSNLFVDSTGPGANTGTIGEYTISGAAVNASLISGLALPVDIAVSGSDLFVANFDGGTIGEYTTSGATVNPALISRVSPTGIAVSGSDLFVANFNTGTIGEYTTAGATVNASLISGLSFPEGIAVFGSDLFIVNGNATSAGSLGPGWIGEYTTSGATVNAKLISGLDSPGYIALATPPAPPAPSGLGYAVAADKGAKGDTFTIVGHSEAGDRVTVLDGKTAIGSAKAGATGIWSITTANPLAVGAHMLSAREVDVAGNTSAHSAAERLTIALAAPNAVTFFGTAGTDRFTGGAGNDVFRFSAADLAATDIVKGGGGNDQLRLTSAGKVRANGVSGVETYVLFNGAGNVLSLTDANFAGVLGSTITVDGGDAGNTLGETGVSALDKAVLRGGAGKDILIAGRNAVLTGGSGKDVFELTVPGSSSAPVSVTITGFNHGVDKIAFSEKGFDLGSAPVAASLFAANKTGSFGTAAQRFAYDTTDGALFFDAHGSASSSRELIATLTHSPTLAASDISFVA